MNNAFYFGFFPRFFLFFFFFCFWSHLKGKVRAWSQNTHAEEFLHCRLGRLCMRRLPLCTLTFRGQSLTSSWEAGCVEEMKSIYIFKKPVWNSLSLLAVPFFFYATARYPHSVCAVVWGYGWKAKRTATLLAFMQGVPRAAHFVLDWLVVVLSSVWGN